MNAVTAELSTDAVARTEGNAPVRDRLMTTIFLAALFHGIVILGVSFGAGSSGDSDALPALEVLLVSERMPAADNNPDANYLAQRTQQGSGNTDKAQRAANPMTASLPYDNPGSADGDSAEDRKNDRETNRHEALVVSSVRSLKLMHLGPVTAATDNTAAQKALLMQAGPPSPLPSSDADDRLILQGRAKPELLTTANTRESAVAVYLDRWKRKIERVGTLHFPQEARRSKLSGNPVLEVQIGPDGAMQECVIRRSSGHAELDQAALSILKLATPFDPLPAPLRERYPSLRFAYEWEFLGGNLVDSAVRAP